MKIDRIRYDVTIPIAAYGINDHIGAEAIVDESEDPADAFLKLKSEVDNMARLAYPHLYKNGQAFETPGYIGMNVTATPYGNEQPISTGENSFVAGNQEHRIGVLASDIESCNDLEVLKTYRFLKDTKPELKEAYDKRLAELSNQ